MLRLQNKEREAKEHMKRKAKELTMQRKDKDRFGGTGSGHGGSATGMGSSSVQPTPAYTPAASASKPTAASSKPKKYACGPACLLPPAHLGG